MPAHDLTIGYSIMFETSRGRGKTDSLCDFSVGFGTRFITVNDKQIKLQIWDTVSVCVVATVYPSHHSNAM